MDRALAARPQRELHDRSVKKGDTNGTGFQWDGPSTVPVD